MGAGTVRVSRRHTQDCPLLRPDRSVLSKHLKAVAKGDSHRAGEEPGPLAPVAFSQWEAPRVPHSYS